MSATRSPRAAARAGSETRELVGGIETRVLEFPGEDPGFVLLHGWSDSAYGWKRVAELLSEAGAWSVCADLPGHGGAELDPERPILEQWDATTRALIERAGGRRTIVGGYSLGGLMSLRIGLDPPPHVVGLAPMAPPTLRRTAWENALQLAGPLLRVATAVPTPIPSSLVHRMTAEVYRRIGFARGDSLTADALEDYLDFWGDRSRIGEQLLAMVRLTTELRVDALDLDEIDLPILLLWGRDDRILGASASEELRRAKPDAEVFLLDDCGHIAPLDAPEAVAEHLLRFRERLGAGAAAQDAG